MVEFGKYFCGNKISDYGVQHGFVDYRTLAKSFEAVLNNDIMAALENAGYYFDLVNGDLVNEEGNDIEIFQFYIIDNAGASILQDYTSEIVFYNSDVDIYIWGVTHYGTNWDYVLTDIPCGKVESV